MEIEFKFTVLVYWLKENPADVEAAKFDLNYIGLEGSIGCLGQLMFFSCVLWQMPLMMSVLL